MAPVLDRFRKEETFTFHLESLTCGTMFVPAEGAIVATSSPAVALPSSFLTRTFLVDCILICGGLEFDGKLLVDCSSWKESG